MNDTSASDTSQSRIFLGKRGLLLLTHPFIISILNANTANNRHPGLSAKILAELHTDQYVIIVMIRPYSGIGRSK